MVKFILAFLLCFFPSGWCLAATQDEAILQKEYGNELKQAPYFLRFKYKNQFNQEWKDSSYESRRKFLKAWDDEVLREEGLAAQKAKDQLQAEAALRRAQEEEIKKKERIAKAISRDKAERLKAKINREKHFKDLVARNKKTVDQMRKRQTELRQRQKRR